MRKLMIIILCGILLLASGVGIARRRHSDARQVRPGMAYPRHRSSLPVSQQMTREAGERGHYDLYPFRRDDIRGGTGLQQPDAADLNLTYAQQQYKASKDSVVYQVYQDYYAILQDQAALDAAQQSLNLEDLQQRITNTQYQLGGASQYEVMQASQNDAASQASLSSAEANLDTAYQQFDQLVGLAIDDHPALTDQPSLEAWMPRSPGCWRPAPVSCRRRIL